MAAVQTKLTPSSTAIQTGWYQIENLAGVWSLSATSNPGDVILPTIANHIATFADTTGTLVDSGLLASSVMLTTAVNTMSGAGQIILVKAAGTEAANAVTASGNAGVITTSALTTAAASTYTITWTNTKITATSTVTVTFMGGTNTTIGAQVRATAGSGTSTLVISNNNVAGTALNGTLLIGYTVF